MEKKPAAGENFENICSEEIKIARRRQNLFEISNPPRNFKISTPHKAI